MLQHVKLYFILALMVVHGPVSAADDELVPPNELITQRSQLEWSVLWWKWAASFQREDSPVADRSGVHCASKQGASVWFLAGTYGTKRTVRSCTVPEGKYLFIPLINYIVTPSRNSSVRCLGVTAEAARMTDPVSALILEVDGKRFDGLERHRQATVDCFDLGDYNTIASTSGPAASNGYFVMLRPLPRGKHVINFGGALPSMLQAVTYNLTVE